MMGEKTYCNNVMKQKLFLHPDIKKTKNGQYTTISRSFLNVYGHKDSFKFNKPLHSTGGLLDSIILDSQILLLFPDVQCNLNIVNAEQDPFNPLKNIKICLNIYDNYSYITGFNGIVFRNEVHLVLIQINTVHVIKILNMQETDKIYSYSCRKNCILDAKLNDHEDTILHLGFTQSNCKLLIKNIQMNTTIFQYVNDIDDTDNFMLFNFIDNSNILLMNRTSVKFINYKSGELTNIFVPEMTKCNFLCTVTNINEFRFVTVSRHSLLESDVRSLKDYNCWSHGLLNTPEFVDICFKGNDTCLCLASRFIDDMMVFKGYPQLNKIPQIVPGIKNFLNNRFLNHPSSLIFDSSRKLHNFTTAGIKLVEVNGDIFVYWCNNGGDLFGQKLDDSDIRSHNVMNIMNESYKFCGSNKTNKLKLTNIADLSCAKFFLNNNAGNNALLNICSPKPFPLFNEKDITSNKLVKNFNSIWVNGCNDFNENSKENLPMPAVHSDEKVRTWIHSTDFKGHIDKIES